MIDIDDIQIIEKSATDTHFQLLYDDKNISSQLQNGHMAIWT